MNTTRQLKVSKLIQKESAQILLTEGKNMFGNTLITVTSVQVSPDLGLAKIYLSIFHKESEKFIKRINEWKHEFRRKLAVRIRNEVRVIPDIIFFLDDSMDYVSKIDELFKKIQDKKS